MNRNKKFTLVLEGKHFEKIDKENFQTILSETQNSQEFITEPEDSKGSFPKELNPEIQINASEQQASTQSFNSERPGN